jgi:hypothetical protein
MFTLFNHVDIQALWRDDILQKYVIPIHTCSHFALTLLTIPAHYSSNRFDVS